MKIAPACLALAFTALVPACALNDRDASAREWRRAECNKVVDSEDRIRCLKRVDDEYGGRSVERDAEKDKARR